MACIFAYYTKKIRGNTLFFIYGFVFIPLAFAYYIPTGAIYFVLPVCKYYASQVMEELYIGFALTVYTIFTILAIFIAKEDIAYAIKAHDKKKE